MKLSVDIDLSFSDVTSQIRNRMCYIYHTACHCLYQASVIHNMKKYQRLSAQGWKADPSSFDLLTQCILLTLWSQCMIRKARTPLAVIDIWTFASEVAQSPLILTVLTKRDGQAVLICHIQPIKSIHSSIKLAGLQCLDAIGWVAGKATSM